MEPAVSKAANGEEVLLPHDPEVFNECMNKLKQDKQKLEGIKIKLFQKLLMVKKFFFLML
ncbi:putative protein phosphatase 2a, regulatory subunit [Corchorus capsularis]|uniref:Uncharacterized protein n=1 Tax=Corchorus capsularis TaxID=210143 RepID=A0A1R3GQK1_COCAP|nr:putative protein phosphatase 2a, regulatory subunit [Corchorus capsularis]